MDTPITISSRSTIANKSDYLQLNYSQERNEETVISLDSPSLERVPVSWKSRNNAFPRTASNTTLSNIQKVSNWINSIEESKPDTIILDSDDDIKDTRLKNNLNATAARAENDSDSKSVILIRCDFNKSISTKQVSCPSLTPFSKSPPSLNHLKNETVNGSTISVRSDLSFKKHNPSNKINVSKHLLLKRSAPSKSINHCNQSSANIQVEDIKMNDVRSEGSSEIYEVPLSPESRKKELCSYLQLMNPADKKEIFSIQNRRSTRVRNLTAMQEKKRRLDEKLSDNGNSENVDKDKEKCPTLKSFKELNIKVEKTKFNQDNSDSEIEKDIFYFPFPSKELTENIEHFDNTMSKLISRYKRICRIKNLKLNCKLEIPKKVLKTSDNVIKSKVNLKGRHLQKKKGIAKINKHQNNTKAKEQKLKDRFKKKYKKPISSRTNSLRSTGKLKNVSLKKLIGRKEKELLNRKNIKRKTGQQQSSSNTSPESKNQTPVDSSSSQCQIVTVHKNVEDNNVDIENLMDDMMDFSSLTEEHKKCLIENRILSTKQIIASGSTEDDPSRSFHNLSEMSPLYGFDKTDISPVEKICAVYKNSVLNSEVEEIIKNFETSVVKIEENEILDAVEHKTEAKTAIEMLVSPILDLDLTDVDNNKLDMKCNEGDDKSTGSRRGLPNGISLQEHDYAGIPSEDEDVEIEDETNMVPINNLVVRNCIEISPRFIEKRKKFELLPYNKSVEMKSLHRSLQHVKRKVNNSSDQSFIREWDNSSKRKFKKQSHYISINKQNGEVLKAFYIDYNLIVCQENVVSFWMQTPLGNVLGSQNMWIPRGQIQRLVLNGNCMQKESMEMVIAMETHVAYIELWTKEHKSDIREGPVADVFATVYFWKQRQIGMDKKVLQLENIKGFADDVQYLVMKSVPKIIVSWHSAHDDLSPKRTFIHAYQLADDFQTVANIYDIEPVDHYVSSLHNIEECESMIMGCGENKITLWNVEYGYIIATITLTDIKSPLSTLWVKCDRGFLFALQQCVDRELRLIAINGINHSWKKLVSYIPQAGFDRLRGVCLENGLLLSFYDQGILCWKAETGEPIEETIIESDIIPSGKYVILIEDEQILVKHAMTHLMSLTIEET